MRRPGIAALALFAITLSACDDQDTSPAAPEPILAAAIGGYSLRGTIAFTSDRDDASGEIYTINADGTGLTRLTFNPSRVDGDPDWSPNGTTIAFVSDSDGSGPQIHAMNADGTGLTRLTSLANPNDPDWSPNGKQIAFSDNFADIYVMNADGSGLTLPPLCHGRTGPVVQDEYLA